MTFGCDVPSAVHAEGCVPKAGGAPARLLFSEQTNRRGLVMEISITDLASLRNKKSFLDCPLCSVVASATRRERGRVMRSGAAALALCLMAVVAAGDDAGDVAFGEGARGRPRVEAADDSSGAFGTLRSSITAGAPDSPPYPAYPPAAPVAPPAPHYPHYPAWPDAPSPPPIPANPPPPYPPWRPGAPPAPPYPPAPPHPPRPPHPAAPHPPPPYTTPPPTRMVYPPHPLGSPAYPPAPLAPAPPPPPPPSRSTAVFFFACAAFIVCTAAWIGFVAGADRPNGDSPDGGGFTGGLRRRLFGEYGSDDELDLELELETGRMTLDGSHESSDVDASAGDFFGRGGARGRTATTPVDDVRNVMARVARGAKAGFDALKTAVRAGEENLQLVAPLLGSDASLSGHEGQRGDQGAGVRMVAIPEDTEAGVDGDGVSSMAGPSRRASRHHMRPGSRELRSSLVVDPNETASPFRPDAHPVSLQSASSIAADDSDHGRDAELDVLNPNYGRVDGVIGMDREMYAFVPDVPVTYEDDYASESDAGYTSRGSAFSEGYSSRGGAGGTRTPRTPSGIHYYGVRAAVPGGGGARPSNRRYDEGWTDEV